jgi:predicted RNA-binding Zn-ribbon protein involved in translation (DUF1610 family)
MTRINCPACGATMNHHAVKIEYGSDQPTSLEFDGVLMNVHTCPECGAVEMTVAD